MSISSVLLNRLLAKVRVRHLQAMVKLVDLGNVQRAALAMDMTQPAVSLLLADLERLMEAPLFLRHAKGVTPTPLMRELLPLVRQVLARLEESAELIARRVERDQGLVRVVATVAGANGVLSGVLPPFAQAHPQVQVLVSEVDQFSLSAVAQTGAADIVFCRLPAVVPQAWRSVTCMPDHFVIACGMQHPLAQRPDVQIEDLATECWLPNTVGSAARDRHEQLFAQHGWPLQASSIVTRISALTWTMLDAQRLLTLVPYSVVRPWVERRQLMVLPLALDMPFDPVCMLLPQHGLSRAAELLSGFVVAHASAPARQTAKHA